MHSSRRLDGSSAASSASRKEFRSQREAEKARPVRRFYQTPAEGGEKEMETQKGEKKEMETPKDEKFEDLFEEISIVEVEDRLAFALLSRCG